MTVHAAVLVVVVEQGDDVVLGQEARVLTLHAVLVAGGVDVTAREVKPSTRSAGSAGASVVGASVVGASVVGASVVGASVVGASVVGASVVGAAVAGASVASDSPPEVPHDAATRATQPSRTERVFGRTARRMER